MLCITLTAAALVAAGGRHDEYEKRCPRHGTTPIFGYLAGLFSSGMRPCLQGGRNTREFVHSWPKKLSKGLTVTVAL
jgi:hypothetical protein